MTGDAEPPCDPGRALAGGEGREALERRWLELTRRALPAAAGPGWPVRHDHCFQRILLDHACGGPWYGAFEGRPAYRHAPEETLARATALGQAVLEGRADIAALNRASLAWRAALRRGRAASRSRRRTSPG